MGMGLRERKKTETRRVITEAALELAVQHGPDAITVDDIAAAADVSPRTVFNHFGTKDEAILGIDPERRAEIAAELLARPSEEAPLEALCTLMCGLLTSADDAGNLWRARAELVRQHPHLRAAQVASQAALEHELAAVIATRTGLDAERDLYPNLVVSAALSALRSVLTRPSSGGRTRLRRDIETAFDHLATGLTPPPRGTR
jgi:AcrR family transcriptional regulator